jgi:hypothetical protein
MTSPSYEGIGARIPKHSMLPAAVFRLCCSEALYLAAGDAEEHAHLLAGYFLEIGQQVRQCRRYAVHKHMRSIPQDMHASVSSCMFA